MSKIGHSGVEKRGHPRFKIDRIKLLSYKDDFRYACDHFYDNNVKSKVALLWKLYHVKCLTKSLILRDKIS